jgi:hypothetical protein
MPIHGGLPFSAGIGKRRSNVPAGQRPAIPLSRTGLRDCREGEAAGVVTKSRHETYRSQRVGPAGNRGA